MDLLNREGYWFVCAVDNRGRLVECGMHATMHSAQRFIENDRTWGSYFLVPSEMIRHYLDRYQSHIDDEPVTMF